MTKRLTGRDDEPATLLDRRSSGREPSNGKGFWLRRVQPDAILALLKLLGVLVTGVLGVVGWRAYSPAQFDGRLTRVEHRVDSLATTQEFIIYLQCVQLRRSDPLAVPPGCPPITEVPRRH